MARFTEFGDPPTREDIEEIALKAARLTLAKIENDFGSLCAEHERLRLNLMVESVAAEVADAYEDD